MAITFELGQVVATARVADILEKDERFARFVTGCMGRYILYDWGDLHPDDWKMNEYAVKNDERILASYPFPQDIQVDGEDRLWIITEWDRSYTTILFPGDY